MGHWYTGNTSALHAEVEGSIPSWPTNLLLSIGLSFLT